MKRVITTPRVGWQQKLEESGFGFHTTDVNYWDESKHYSITSQEADAIYYATEELWEISLTAVQHVIDKKLYHKFHIPEFMWQHIEDSWNNDVPSIYGRFDLVIKEDGSIKMLEFNADTPTSLFEAGVIQWQWLQDKFKDKDQFNSIHEQLIEYWVYLKPYLNPGTLYFSCIRDSLEDFTTVEYMRDCAIQAGIDTELIFIDEIGWNGQSFTDLSERSINNLFKLYPWEWLVNEEFGTNVPKTETLFIEPSWKMILSNKAILPILYELFPNNKYLLKAYFEKGRLSSYAKKPLLSREGANIKIYENGVLTEETEGEYGEEGFIYQELCKLPEFGNDKTLVGSWIVGQKPVGIGFRESSTFISDDKSRFVPHLIED